MKAPLKSLTSTPSRYLIQMDSLDYLRNERVHIEAKMEEDARRLRELKCRWNLAQLIFTRLPAVELLEQMSVWYALSMGLGCVPDMFFPQPYQWLYITHVCHHWRQVALGLQRLWRYIVPIRPECVSVMLARSRQETISIFPSVGEPREHRDFYIDNEDMADACDIAFQQLHRIECLVFAAPSTAMRALKRVSNASTLSLRHLNILQPTDCNAFGLADAIAELTRDGVPVLERFECDYFLKSLATIKPLLHPTIRHLRLSHVPSDEAPSCLLNILADLVHLHSLELEIVSSLFRR